MFPNPDCEVVFPVYCKHKYCMPITTNIIGIYGYGYRNQIAVSLVHISLEVSFGHIKGSLKHDCVDFGG